MSKDITLITVFIDGVSTQVDRDLVPKDSDGRAYDNVLLVNGNYVIDEPKLTEVILTKSKAKINSDFEDSMNSLVGNIPKKEQDTWIKQEAEALAYQANNDAITPILDGIVAGRDSVTKDSLVLKVLYKADLYANACGVLLGKKQQEEDLLESE